MLSLMVHFYNYAEAYTILFTWITVPLGFYVIYRFLRTQYGMFVPTAPDGKEAPAHGGN